MKQNKNFLDVPLLSHQLDFVTDITTPNLGLVAGYGAGKTYSFAIKGIYMASLNIGYVGLLLEPTFTMCNDTLIPMMDQVLTEMGLEYTYKASPQPEYKIRFAEGISTIKIRSAENYRRLAGMNLAWAGVDEIDTITNKEETAKIWRMLQSRKRRGDVRQIFTTSTPEGFGFLYNYFVVNKNKDGVLDTSKRMIKASSRNNPFLPPDYIDGLLAAYPEHLKKAYIDGEFVNLTAGNVYHLFDRVLNATKFKEADFHSSWPLFVGVDFNQNIMATALMFINDATGEIFVVDEIFGEKDSTSLIARLRRSYPQRRMILICDASGNRGTGITDVALFSNAGFDVSNIDRSNPMIRDRVNSVNVKLCNGAGQRTLLVNIDQCPNVVQTFEQQGWKDDMPDKTSGLDHMGDGIGYVIYKKFPIKSKNKGIIRVHN